MDSLINNIVSKSDSEKDLEELRQFLVLQSNVLDAAHSTLSDAIQALDPVAHSLGLAFILNALTKSVDTGRKDANTIMGTVPPFVHACSATQIRIAPDIFCALCRRLKDHVMGLQCPIQGILPLQQAIRKLQPSSEYLTPIHADLFQLCLVAKVYNAAVPFVEEDIFECDPALTALTPTDVLLYCYYGGMICIGRKHYNRALELFLQGLTAPTTVANAITTAMYKKFALVSLLHTGKAAHLPSFTAIKVKHLVESTCRPYIELSNAFAMNKMEKVNKVLEQHRKTFIQDANLGLSKHVAVALIKGNIQRLTQTYMTLSLERFSQNVGLSGAMQAESYILRMVEDGEIHANINCRDGMVTFAEEPETFCSNETSKMIDQHIGKCCELASRLQNVHEKICLDPNYLTKVKDRSKHGHGEDGVAGQMLYQP